MEILSPSNYLNILSPHRPLLPALLLLEGLLPLARPRNETAHRTVGHAPTTLVRPPDLVHALPVTAERLFGVVVVDVRNIVTGTATPLQADLILTGEELLEGVAESHHSPPRTLPRRDVYPFQGALAREVQPYDLEMTEAPRVGGPPVMSVVGARGLLARFRIVVPAVGVVVGIALHLVRPGDVARPVRIPDGATRRTLAVRVGHDRGGVHAV